MVGSKLSEFRSGLDLLEIGQTEFGIRMRTGLFVLAATAEWSCCLVRTTKVLCSNLGATRHRMTLGKSIAAGRCIVITCDIHRLM